MIENFVIDTIIRDNSQIAFANASHRRARLHNTCTEVVENYEACMHLIMKIMPGILVTDFLFFSF